MADDDFMIDLFDLALDQASSALAGAAKPAQEGRGYDYFVQAGIAEVKELINVIVAAIQNGSAITAKGDHVALDLLRVLQFIEQQEVSGVNNPEEALLCALRLAPAVLDEPGLLHDIAEWPQAPDSPANIQAAAMRLAEALRSDEWKKFDQQLLNWAFNSQPVVNEIAMLEARILSTEAVSAKPAPPPTNI